MLTTNHLNQALTPIYDLLRGSAAKEAELTALVRGIGGQLTTLMDKLTDRGLKQ
jgi:hypothetical protein